MSFKNGAILWAAWAGVMGLFLVPAGAADWPTFRGDAARSGYTADALPKSMGLAWTFRAPAPRPAWPTNGRLNFDAALQPVIGGATLYFGDSADCKVYAIDATTGALRWTVMMDAPIRFAPVFWRDRVIAGADDGWVICLDAASGKTLWRQRLAPRSDLLLGNDRMISRWPVRGGPVVADDVLYVGAGIWPSEGVTICAMNPETGAVLWKNDSSGSIEMNQPHPGARARSGVAAQGYLVVQGRELLVPTGRAVPAVFDRQTGRFVSFPLAIFLKNGGCDAVAFDKHVFNHGVLFPAGTDVKPLAMGTQVAVHPKWVLACKGAKLSAWDRGRLVTAPKPDKSGKAIPPALMAAAWTLDLSEPSESALIVAGDAAFLGGAGHVSLVDLAAREAGWKSKVEGNACGLAAANGRLFVSTDKGVISCFTADAPAAVASPAPMPQLPPEDARASAAAQEVLKLSNLSEGYCLDLGCGEGRLTLELARRSKLQIVAVDPDPANVESLKRALDRAGWYGTRIVVFQADLDRAPLPRYFADLIVSGRAIGEQGSTVPVEAINRFQRPCGGVACIGPAGGMKAARRGPLEGAGQWSHQYADAANTLCSGDAILKGSLGALWFRDPDLPMPNRHGRSPAPLVVDGRMIVEGLASLRATSIYNGRTLWETALPGNLKRFHQDHLVGTAATGSNVCASSDRIYLAHGDRCYVYRVADGSKLGEFMAPPGADGKPGTWGLLAVDGNTLLGSLANDEHVVSWRFKKSDMAGLWTESRSLFAMDAATGKVKWTYAARDSIRHNAVAIGQGRVYLIDRPVALMDGIGFPPLAKTTAPATKPAGPPPPKHELGQLLALDAETGKTLWQTDKKVFGTLLALSAKHDVLLMGYQPTAFKLSSEKGGQLAGFGAKDGARLWDRTANYSARPILNDRTVYAFPIALDLVTGEAQDVKMKRSYGCGIPGASQNMLVFRSATVGYIDLTSTPQTENYGGIRPGCWVNTIPAGGLVLMADAASGCECSYLNQAMMALQTMEGER